MMVPLHTALGGLARIAQFFVWRLEWSATEGKYHKQPFDPKTGRPMAKGCAQDNPAQWMTFEAAATTAQQLNAWQDGYVYALGFWLTADSGYWFLDLDKSVNTDGSVSSLATDLLQRLPGACGEYSSSANPPPGMGPVPAGLHVFGRGSAPPHTTKNSRLNLEFYTDARGVAFGLTGQAWGSADTVHDDAVRTICDVYFRVTAQSGEACMTGPRADWRGPEDDSALLALAFSRKSAAAAFGQKASLEQLMRGDAAELYPFYNDGSALLASEADMALAAHLAYWTGCFVPRMERIARMSGLYRDKWDEQRPLPDGSYASWIGYTCFNAAQTTPNVLQQVERGSAAVAKAALPVTAESVAVNSDWIMRVQRALEDELRNEVIPAIAADASINDLDRDRLAALVKERFKIFGFPMTISRARQLVAAPRIERPVSDAPEWAHSHVYVTGIDKFYNLLNGKLLTRTAFGAEFNRLMPMRENGDREDAAKWCLERWNTSTVHGLLYWPGRTALFDYEGFTYANTYNESSLTPVANEWTERGVAGINAFRAHLWNLCGQREPLYSTLLTWMAHNVQYPGRKIRFAPLIKGTQGDGKSMIGGILAHAMGGRNVKIIGSDAFSDRFTDWAHGAAVGIIEEIMMTGRERYFVANKLKLYITNDTVTIRPLGGAMFNAPNTMNYAAWTNHGDAVPLEDNDRRWLVIFSPFSSKAQLDATYGGDSAAMFKSIFDSVKTCPGEWRRWLLEYPIPDTFNPDAPAPFTVEKEQMRASGVEEADSLAQAIIEEGAYGVTPTLLSSNMLSKVMNVKALTDGYELPKGKAMNHMLSRMGYSQFPKTVKWDGAMHRVWMKDATYSSTEAIRAQLDATKA